MDRRPPVAQFNSDSNHALADLQSRATVSAETFRTAAVSFYGQSPKRNSITWALRGSAAISLSKPAERVRVLTINGNALYASGYLLWLNDGTLVAQEFDAATLKLSGEPHPLAEGVTRHDPLPKMNVAVSANGYLLYDASVPQFHLQSFDPSGKALGLAGELSGIGNFRIARDGRRIAAIARNPVTGNDLWVVGENSVPSPVTSQRMTFTSAMWSPGGQNMVVSVVVPKLNLNRVDLNGSGELVRLTQSPNNQFVTDWSGDGRSILFVENAPQTHHDLWVLPVTPEGVLEEAKPRIYLQTPSFETWGRFSPEPSPRWVAYQSNVSGRNEIYVAAFPVAHRKFHISPHGGSYPMWGPDGRELYYETLDDKLVAVSLKVGADSVEASTPRELFALPPSRGSPPYDVAPDGKRFLVRVEARNDAGLTLVTNWPALIKKSSAAR